MATIIKKFPVYMQQDRNMSSKGYNHWYPRTNRSETLTLRGLIERVAFEQSVYSRDIIEGVISRLTKVMVEQLTSGQAVKWPSLGTFKVELEGVKGGVNASAIKDGTANARDQIEGVHVRLIPEGAQGEDITSVAFRDSCSFQLDGVKVFTVVGAGADAKEVSSIISMAEYRYRTGVTTLLNVTANEEDQIGEDSEYNVGEAIQFPLSGRVVNMEEGAGYMVALVPDNKHIGDIISAGENTLDVNAQGNFSGNIKALNTTPGAEWSRQLVLAKDLQILLPWSEFVGTAPE